MKTQKQEPKKYTVLTNSAGCKIRGMMSEKEVAEATATGIWSVAQIEEAQ